MGADSPSGDAKGWIEREGRVFVGYVKSRRRWILRRSTGHLGDMFDNSSFEGSLFVHDRSLNSLDSFKVQSFVVVDNASL